MTRSTAKEQSCEICHMKYVNLQHASSSIFLHINPQDYLTACHKHDYYFITFLKPCYMAISRAGKIPLIAFSLPILLI